MKDVTLSTFAAALLLVAVAGFTAYTTDLQPGPALPAKSTLRVTSTAETPITFEASYESASLPNGGTFIEAHQTPFEIEVPAQDFRGVFHKTEGAGRMRVSVEGTGGNLQAKFNITAVVLSGEEHAVFGLP